MIGRPAAIGGYRVYRRALPEEAYDAPLERGPRSRAVFVDDDGAVRRGRSCTRSARRCRGKPNDRAGPRRSRPASTPGRLPSRRARAPGRPPRGRSGAGSSGTPSVAPDLAGYVVYRAEGRAARGAVAEKPIADTSFTDTACSRGTGTGTPSSPWMRRAMRARRPRRPSRNRFRHARSLAGTAARRNTTRRSEWPPTIVRQDGGRGQRLPPLRGGRPPALATRTRDDSPALPPGHCRSAPTASSSSPGGGNGRIRLDYYNADGGLASVLRERHPLRGALRGDPRGSSRTRSSSWTRAGARSARAWTGSRSLSRSGTSSCRASRSFSTRGVPTGIRRPV